MVAADACSARSHQLSVGYCIFSPGAYGVLLPQVVRVVCLTHEGGIMAQHEHPKFQISEKPTVTAVRCLLSDSRSKF